MARQRRRSHGILTLMIIRNTRHPSVVPITRLLRPTRMNHIRCNRRSNVLSRVSTTRIMTRIRNPRLKVRSLLRRNMISKRLLTSLLLHRIRISTPISRIHGLFPIKRITIISSRTLRRHPILTSKTNSSRHVSLITRLTRRTLLSQTNALTNGAIINHRQAIKEK